MATKKQKRQAVIAAREAFLEETRRSGLEAQKKDQALRARKERAEWQDNHDKRHSWQKRIKECPICNDELRAAAKAKAELEAEKVLADLNPGVTQSDFVLVP